MILRYLASRTIKAIVFSIWDCLFPKNHTKIVLVVKNRTEFSGNIRVVTDILLQEKKYKLYIYKDGKVIPRIKENLEKEGVSVLEGWSIKSLYHLLTSGIFFFSHAPRDAHITKKCKKRVIINLWHGVAFKSIENLMPDIAHTKQKQIQNNAKLYDFILASSEADKKINMSAFMVDSSRVHVTGLPRYDILKNSYPLDTFLEDQKSNLLAYKNNKRMILYAPTFREKNISAIDQMSNKDWDILNQVLKKYNAIMAIRPHSYDAALPSYINNNESFFLLPHKTFTETNLILQFTDILLVDFSSIWIDFLLLNRPIIGFAKDFEHYMHKERGFVYNFEETFPDNFYTNIMPLSLHLETLLVNSVYKKMYGETTSLFHKYPLQTEFSSIFRKNLTLSQLI